MKRLVFHITLFVCVANAVFAQDPHFTQINRIPSFYNPAAAGNGVEHIRLTMLYRNQWASVTSPFVTQGFFFDKQVGKVGLGANLVNNSAGDAGIRQLLLNGILNYRFDFNRHHFTAGMQVGLIQKSFDPSKMTFDDQFLPDQGFDPSHATAETFSYTKVTRPDLGLGMFWTYGKPGSDRAFPFVGISAQHILQPKETFIIDQNTVPIKFNAHAGIGIHVNDDLQIIPSVLFVKQQHSSELVAGTVVRLPLQDRNMVEGGIYYRHGDAMALYGAYQWNNLLLGASYDVNISGLTKGPGAFELTLTYIPKAKIKKQPEKKVLKPTVVKKPVTVKKPNVAPKPTEAKNQETKAPAKVVTTNKNKTVTKHETPVKPKPTGTTVKISTTAQPKQNRTAIDSIKVKAIIAKPVIPQPAVKVIAPIVQPKTKVDSVVTSSITPRNTNKIAEIKRIPVSINKNAIKKPSSEIDKPSIHATSIRLELPMGDVEEISLLVAKPISIDKSTLKKPSLKIAPIKVMENYTSNLVSIEREVAIVKELKSKPLTIDKSWIKKPVMRIAIPALPIVADNSASIRNESVIKLLNSIKIKIDRKAIKKPLSTIIAPVYNREDVVFGSDFRKEGAIKLMKSKSININKKSIRKPALTLQIAMDSDKDGVDDKMDKCPNQKGTIMNLGCPEITKANSNGQVVNAAVNPAQVVVEAPLEIELTELNSSYMGAIEFEKGKAQSHGIYKIDVIEPAIDSAWFNKDYSIVLTGHTYQEAEAKSAIELSKARVEIVKSIFVKKGIDASRIQVVPYGDRKLATTGKSVYDIAKNRRVEVYILKK